MFAKKNLKYKIWIRFLTHFLLISQHGGMTNNFAFNDIFRKNFEPFYVQKNVTKEKCCIKAFRVSVNTSDLNGDCQRTKIPFMIEDSISHTTQSCVEPQCGFDFAAAGNRRCTRWWWCLKVPGQGCCLSCFYEGDQDAAGWGLYENARWTREDAKQNTKNKKW